MTTSTFELKVDGGSASSADAVVTGVVKELVLLDQILGTGDGTATTVGATLIGPRRTGTNAVGSDVIFGAGNGTGTGGGGNLIFQTAPAGASGSTGNTLTERLRIDNAGLANFKNNLRVEYGNYIGFPDVGAGFVKGGNGSFITTHSLGLQLSADNSDGVIRFTTGNTSGTPIERMRIDASGNVGIGTASPQKRFHVNTNDSSPTIALGNFDGVKTIWLHDDAGTYGGGSVIGPPGAASSSLLSNGARRLIADANGNITIPILAGSGNRAVYSDANGLLTNSSSDIRLKDTISSLSSCLVKTLALNPVSYQWKDKSRLGAQTEIGFIAQEVEPIVPEVIGTNNDGTLSLDYPKLTAVLAGAIKELSSKFDAYVAAHS